MKSKLVMAASAVTLALGICVASAQTQPPPVPGAYIGPAGKLRVERALLPPMAGQTVTATCPPSFSSTSASSGSQPQFNGWTVSVAGNFLHAKVQDPATMTSGTLLVCWYTTNQRDSAFSVSRNLGAGTAAGNCALQGASVSCRVQ